MYGLAETLVELGIRGTQPVRSVHLLSIGTWKWRRRVPRQNLQGREAGTPDPVLIHISWGREDPEGQCPVQLLKEDSGLQEDLQKVWIPRTSSDSVTGAQKT